MLIKEFCDATGLPRDTVRFYVRRGLLKPDIGSGEGNRYQVFDADQVDRGLAIKAAQRLGFSLKEIAGFADRYDAGQLDTESKVAAVLAHIARLEDRRGDLDRMLGYLKAKAAWLQNGESGRAPAFGGSGTAKLKKTVNAKAPRLGSHRTHADERGCRKADP